MILTSKEKTKYRATAQFKDLRKQGIEKYHKRCGICGCKPRRLEVHHKNPSKYKEEDEMEFLIPLCSTCHSYIEYCIRVLNNKKNPVIEYTQQLFEFIQNFTSELTSDKGGTV
jgi:hypothetical protein